MVDYPLAAKGELEEESSTTQDAAIASVSHRQPRDRKNSG